jgi:fumarate reductase flavoprotein subunit
MTTIYYQGAIIVNKAAKRFVNESLSYKLLGDEALSQEDHASYIAFDDNIRRAKMKESPKDVKLWGAIDEGKEMPYAFYGNTIEDATKKAGLDPKALKATIEQYNKLAPAGKDPLGRKNLFLPAMANPWRSKSRRLSSRPPQPA